MRTTHFGTVDNAILLLYSSFKQDPSWFKCISATLWVIDGTHQITVSAMISQYSGGMILALPCIFKIFFFEGAPLWRPQICSTEQLVRHAAGSFTFKVYLGLHHTRGSAAFEHL
ncbi:hypothetical protein BS47DRAFT_1088645 [Hydnum rufescens UP504]|uniref:Uncharacterized protein n=1 Tax=Hydnum rufescens UP504 TaxID=1448309 RepID=A0A9P6AV21_9AGAM|nr:hypothetical protein BS47DRAFT_1088645 [Hydnum rufescens UP504]